MHNTRSGAVDMLAVQLVDVTTHEKKPRITFRCSTQSIKQFIPYLHTTPAFPQHCRRRRRGTYLYVLHLSHYRLVTLTTELLEILPLRAGEVFIVYSMPESHEEVSFAQCE